MLLPILIYRYCFSGLLIFIITTKPDFVQAQAETIPYLKPKSARVLNDELDKGLEERKKAEASRRPDFQPKKVLYIIDRKFIWTEFAPPINLDRISNITVVADSIAATLYGSMGADGAIIITTKRFPQRYLHQVFTKKGRLK